MKNNYIKCPLNYIGGKTKILDQIFKYFPDNISTFVEPFSGGYNVGVNITAKKIIAIDTNKYLQDMFTNFKNKPLDETINSIEKTIKDYDLSLTNIEGYNTLRENYNTNKDYIKLFVLSCYSFNHQLRYNNSLNFNTPFGKNRSKYNPNIKNNLIKFITKIKQQNVNFLTSDFRNFNIDCLDENSFVYLDPPYLITTGSYNDGTRGFGDWKEKEENDLLLFLDKLNEKNIKFALSNVLLHKGNENLILKKWAKNYKIHFINTNYNNSNYHSLAKNHETVEVLITNY